MNRVGTDERMNRVLRELRNVRDLLGEMKGTVEVALKAAIQGTDRMRELAETGAEQSLVEEAVDILRRELTPEACAKLAQGLAAAAQPTEDATQRLAHRHLQDESEESLGSGGEKPNATQQLSGLAQSQCGRCELEKLKSGLGQQEIEERARARAAAEPARVNRQVGPHGEVGGTVGGWGTKRQRVQQLEKDDAGG